MIYELLTTDGELATLGIKEDLSLDVIQDAVGGYFEYLPCSIPDGELLVNEEGRLLGLPVNEIASVYFTPKDIFLVVGDVIIGTPKGIEHHMADILATFEEEE